MPPRLCATSFFVLLLVVIAQLGMVQAIFRLTYTIEVHADGSADWIVEVKGTDISTSFDSFNTFVENVSILVNMAKQTTERNMTASGFSMAVNVSGSYQIVTYQFAWSAFASVQDRQVILGDVFMVADFFSYFCGDGEVFVVYPSGYLVESVFPPPSERADESQTLEWYGINDFESGEPRIVLSEKASADSLDSIRGNAVFIISFLAFVVVGSVGFYYLRFRKGQRARKGLEEPQTLALEKSFEFEDEEKVANLLKAAGGRMYQSAIADQCDFSRSKASKLLAAMESKGKVRREDKGREKVVTLIERKEESSKAGRS